MSINANKKKKFIKSLGMLDTNYSQVKASRTLGELDVCYDTAVHNLLFAPFCNKPKKMA